MHIGKIVVNALALKKMEFTNFNDTLH